MSRKELDKVKANKVAIIKAVRDVAEEMFKLDELLEDIGCDATPDEWNAIFKDWMDKDYPLHDDIGEVAWQLIDYADELEGSE
jgi:hypothetical protein